MKKFQRQLTILFKGSQIFHPITQRLIFNSLSKDVLSLKKSLTLAIQMNMILHSRHVSFLVINRFEKPAM